MLHFFRNRWFLLTLALLLAVGFGFPSALEPLTVRIPRQLIVAGVLFLMALPLDASSMWQALRRPKAVLLAVLLNAVAVPLLAWPVSWLLRAELSAGLMIAASVPSTLASAAVWTRRAGGNDAVAILCTMITNLACFVVVPVWLFASTGQDVELDPPLEMMAKLGVLVVIPIFLGQMLRLVKPCGTWAVRNKVPLGVVAQCGILTMVLVGAVSAGQELATGEESIGPGDWVLMIACVVGVHMAVLFGGHVIGRTIGVSRVDRIAVGFGGSQKTLMIGLHIATTYFGGLAMLPMITYHVAQLLLDTLVADWLRERTPEDRSPSAA